MRPELSSLARKTFARLTPGLILISIVIVIGILPL
jgi:hypothetical protein